MKTDLNSLKKELGRLTDVQYLKKELNRITKEVKNFDFNAHLTPQARERVEHLERRFNEALKTLAVLQKQVDENFERLKERIGRTPVGSKLSVRFANGRGTGRKASATTKRAAATTTTAKKAVRKARSKKKTAKKS